VKSAFRDKNAKLKKLALLRLHLLNVMFSDLRSMSLLRNMRLASLPQNVRLRNSTFPKYYWPNDWQKAITKISKGMWIDVTAFAILPY